jgi:hypothetical protein
MTPPAERGLSGHPEYVSIVQANPRLEGWYRYVTEGLPNQITDDPIRVAEVLKHTITLGLIKGPIATLPEEVMRADVVFEHPDTSEEVITGAKFPIPMIRFKTETDYERFLRSIGKKAIIPSLEVHLDIGQFAHAFQGGAVVGTVQSRPMTVGIFCQQQLGEDYPSPEQIENQLVLRAIDPYYFDRKGDDEFISEMIGQVGKNAGNDMHPGKIELRESEILPLFQYFQRKYFRAEQVENADLRKLLGIPNYSHVSPRFLAHMAVGLIRAASGENATLIRKLMSYHDLRSANADMRSYKPDYYLTLKNTQSADVYDPQRVNLINALAALQMDDDYPGLRYYFSHWPEAFTVSPDRRSVSSLWQQPQFALHAMTIFDKNMVVLASPQPGTLELSDLEHLHMSLLGLDNLERNSRSIFDTDGITRVDVSYNQEGPDTRATARW